MEMLGFSHVSVRITIHGLAVSKMFQNSTTLFVSLRQLMTRTHKLDGKGKFLTIVNTGRWVFLTGVEQVQQRLLHYQRSL